MQKVSRFLLVLMISIISFLIPACSNSYNEMIDGFNGKYFKKGYLPPAPYTTSSENFEEDKMLDEIISMKDDSLTILIAPDGGEETLYEWKALVPAKDANGKSFMNETVIGNKRTLSYKAPGVFNSDKENKLIVTVTEKSGRQFTDTAKVFIEIE